MEIPRRGVESEPQLTAYITAPGNVGSEQHLRPTPQLTATPDPWPTELGQRSNPESSWILVRFISAVPPWELHDWLNFKWVASVSNTSYFVVPDFHRGLEITRSYVWRLWRTNQGKEVISSFRVAQSRAKWVAPRGWGWFKISIDIGISSSRWLKICKCLTKLIDIWESPGYRVKNSI